MRAGATVVAGNLVGAGAAFTAAIIAARALPLDQFAAFGVGLAVNSLAVQFADFGLGTVAIAETADAAHPKAARVKLRALARHRIGTAVGVCLLVVAVTVALPSLAPYRAAATIGAAGAVFGSFALFLIWSLQGERSFAAAGALQSLQGLGRLLLVGVAAIGGLGAAPMMVGYAIVAPALTAAIGAWLLFARRRPGGDVGTDLLPGADGVNVSRRRVMAVAGVLAAMLINGDVLLLTVLAGSSEVAAYTAAWRFSSGLLLINTAIASALLPFIIAADDAWAETRKLLRWGLLAMLGWLVALPALALIGPLLLGAVGEDARGPLIVLLFAFAIDGFYFVVYQIYLRVRREWLLLVIVAIELVTMVVVTVLLRDEGAMAPAYGQLAARIVVGAAVMAPIALAALGRCSWFAGPGKAALAPSAPAD